MIIYYSSSRKLIKTDKICIYKTYISFKANNTFSMKSSKLFFRCEMSQTSVRIERNLSWIYIITTQFCQIIKFAIFAWYFWKQIKRNKVPWVPSSLNVSLKLNVTFLCVLFLILFISKQCNFLFHIFYLYKPVS